MINQTKSVLLGMSGGTDSSVAAMLLQEQGYEVTGVTFRFYEKDGQQDYLRDATELAKRLGIKHLVYDAREHFQTLIIDYFVKEYFSGRTPVPCMLCNNYLKWPLLIKLADEMGISSVSTGHYVRKRLVDGTYYIIPGIDQDKDQSFFLWGLPQHIIARMLLPMGDITKVEVRKMAAERGFQKISEKKDSLGVCFCPMDYRTFLKEYPACPPLLTTRRGQFIDEKGCFIAFHEGYPFYTIGQRRGLGIHLNKAVFVKEICQETNKIVLAPLSSLEKLLFFVKDWNIVNERLLLNNPEVIVKIRYRKQVNKCTVTISENRWLRVELDEPLTAVAPGQAAAFYLGELLIGGGIIELVSTKE